MDEEIIYRKYIIMKEEIQMIQYYYERRNGRIQIIYVKNDKQTLKEMSWKYTMKPVMKW